MTEYRSMKNVVALDWSQKGLDLAFVDEHGTIQTIKEKLSLVNFIRTYHARFNEIYLESSYESYSKKTRQLVNNTADEFGVTLRIINPRETANWRKHKGVTKTDATDAVCILEMAQAGRKIFELAKPMPKVEELVKHIPTNDAEWKEFYKQVARYRNQGWPELFKNPSDEFLKEAVTLFKQVQSSRQYLYELGDKKKFSVPFVLPFVLLAILCSSRKEFLKRAGLYGNGFPNIFRSNFYYSRTHALIKRHFKDAGLGTKVKSWDQKEVIKVRKRTMQQLHLAVRFVYGEVKRQQQLATDTESIMVFGESN